MEIFLVRTKMGSYKTNNVVNLKSCIYYKTNEVSTASLVDVFQTNLGSGVPLLSAAYTSKDHGRSVLESNE